MDFIELLSLSEKFSGMIPSSGISNFIRKSSRSLILGINYTAYLLSDIKIKSRDSYGDKSERMLKRNTNLLLDLFFRSLAKAGEMEKNPAIYLSEKKINLFSVSPGDIMLLLFSFSVLIYTIVLL